MANRSSRWTTARVAAGLSVVLVGALACQPGSVTEARDQLARAGERTYQLVLPISLDTVVVDQFLPEGVDTVVDGLFGANLVEQEFVVPAVDAFLVPVEFTLFDVDFGDFNDVIRDVVINRARVRLRLRNDSAQATVLANVTLGLVRLNPDGSVPLDAGGRPVYEPDPGGAERIVTIADPGDTLVTVAGQSTSVLEFNAAPVVDGLVNLVLDSVRAAIVLSGNGSGGGTPLGLLDGFVRVTVLLDLTLPAAGVQFASDSAFDGAQLDIDDATEVADRVDSSAFIAAVENRTPFAVDVEFAFVAGQVPGVDPFTAPGGVVLDPISVGGTVVDASGKVASPVTDTAEVTLTGQETLPLLGDRFTARARLTFRGSPASDGRGVLGPDEVVVFSSRVRVWVRTGGVAP